MKLAQLVREHTDADVTVFYLDIRAPGKGCEEFYDKSLKEGIQFVRGRVENSTSLRAKHMLLCAISLQP